LDQHSYNADDNDEDPICVHDFFCFDVYGAKIMDFFRLFVEKIADQHGFSLFLKNF
jgi:hypothetical protein